MAPEADERADGVAALPHGVPFPRACAPRLAAVDRRARPDRGGGRGGHRPVGRDRRAARPHRPRRARGEGAQLDPPLAAHPATLPPCHPGSRPATLLQVLNSMLYWLLDLCYKRVNAGEKVRRLLPPPRASPPRGCRLAPAWQPPTTAWPPRDGRCPSGLPSRTCCAAPAWRPASWPSSPRSATSSACSPRARSARTASASYAPTKCCSTSKRRERRGARAASAAVPPPNYRPRGPPCDRHAATVNNGRRAAGGNDVHSLRHHPGLLRRRVPRRPRRVRGCALLPLPHPGQAGADGVRGPRLAARPRRRVRRGEGGHGEQPHPPSSALCPRGRRRSLPPCSPRNRRCGRHCPSGATQSSSSGTWMTTGATSACFRSSRAGCARSLASPTRRCA